MQDFWSTISPWVISGIGGFVGAALLLPTKLGEAVIKFRFDKSVESLRADYARELETTRATSASDLAKLTEQLNNLSDRGKRSNEQEFDAITSVWENFVDCFDCAEAAIVQYTEIPDLDNFTYEEVDSFLSTRDFSKEQIDQVQRSKEKVRTYGQIARWKCIATAHNAIMKTRAALRKQIFIPVDLTFEIEKAIDRAFIAVAAELMHFRNPNSSAYVEESISFFKERNEIFSKVKETVQNRLMRSDPRTFAKDN